MAVAEDVKVTLMVGFPDYDISASPAWLIAAGLLVGFALGLVQVYQDMACGLSDYRPAHWCNARVYGVWRAYRHSD